MVLNTARALLLLSLLSLQVFAQVPERSRENLMVVVRESIGANRPDDSFTPTGKVKAQLPDGRIIEMEMYSWEYIGDIHIRFVFDGPRTMINATPQDISKLGLGSLDDALALAMANIKRVYGEPSTTPWEGGLLQVKGRSPDLHSSYFLDRSYWQELLKKHPEGLVVSVAKRGGLLYAPLSDVTTVERLKRGVAYLHSSSERLRVSSALFLFKDGKWSVFQAPVKQ
jgi:hypothetical protein